MYIFVMGAIVGIAGVLSLVLAQSRGLPWAFLNVYLPVMLMLPDYYRWVLPALPDPTFGEAAILPLAVLFILRHAREWRFSLADFLILGFALSMGISEFINAGYGDAQNLMFDMLGSIVFPYMLAKGLVEPRGLRIEFAKKLVMPLFLVAMISVYEFRFGREPWQMYLGKFFPGQGEGWVTTFRWGFARIAGPYGHAILAGLLMIVGYRLQRWLEWSNAWEPRWKRLPWLGSKGRTITLGLLLGVIMTMVRGPWIGGIVGAMLPLIGRAKNRRAALYTLFAGIVLIGVPAGIVLYNYASVGRAQAKSDSQETAAYRKELIDKYVAIAEQRGAWGWGTSGWPKVEGMPSIDNYYLLLALMHGGIALFFLLAILFYMIVRLMARGMSRPPPALRGASPAFTLAGIHVAILITIATVYMGVQVVPVFALMAGWSVGYLLADKEPALAAVRSPGAQSVPAVAQRYRFARVVA